MEAIAISEYEGSPRADDLVSRARRGDFAAFEELYRQHMPRTYALCLRLTSRPARAEELTQETFIRVWEKLGSLRGAEEFGGWLRRVAVNVVLADQRARRRRERKHATLADDVLPFEPPRDAASTAGSLDLEKAIAGLPARARNVFVLHDIEGYRHDEIAALLEVTAGTSKAQLHRARKLLREALRP